MLAMHLILFLGNPGSEYTHTRHNAGWIVCDELFASQTWTMDKYANAEVAELQIENEAVLLAKPHTFMNNSGESAKYLTQKYEISPDRVIVVYDDIDIPVGGVKVSATGQSNHNGILSLIRSLKTEEFIRIRVGIGGGNGPLRDYVLGRLTLDEEITLQNTALGIQKILESIVTIGVALTQNNLKKILDK